MEQQTTQVLVVDDNPEIRDIIHVLLEGEGIRVTEAADGSSALHFLEKGSFDLIILDIMMPGISGLKTCEEIRKISYVPILFLTAKSKESDKLIGFMAGADDYLIKPFSYTELFARVRSLLRRHQVYDREILQIQKEEWIEIHQICINSSKNIVFQQGNEIQLTEIEYKILLLLIQYPTKIFSLQNLYESIWEEPFISTSANTIMVHIRNLRTKIEENPQKPKIIQTVWGKGYRLG